LEIWFCNLVFACDLVLGFGILTPAHPLPIAIIIAFPKGMPMAKKYSRIYGYIHIFALSGTKNSATYPTQ